MNYSDPAKLTCFCIFRHNPFERGKEGGEDGSHILEQLIYRYPSKLSDRSMEHLLSVLISLYTFTSLSLDGKKLDFLSWSNSKVAIQTYKRESDGSLLFFVLRVPSIYSDFSIMKALEHIKSGLFFVLGPEGFSSIEILKDYLKNNGNRLCSVIVPNSSGLSSASNVYNNYNSNYNSNYNNANSSANSNTNNNSNNNLNFENRLTFSFTNLPNAEWHRPNVATVLTEVTLMQTYSEVWGIVCFSNGLLLASHSPIDVIRFFDFVTTNNTNTCFSNGLNDNVLNENNNNSTTSNNNNNNNSVSNDGVSSNTNEGNNNSIPQSSPAAALSSSSSSSILNDSKRTKVYLTKKDRSFLLEFPGSISQIPDNDVIEAALLKFQHESVIFYLLADPHIPQDVYEKIHETLTRAMPEILAVSPESKGKSTIPQNTLVYNSVLNILTSGAATDEFQTMAVTAHDLFAKEENLRDIIMHNAREFAVCMNILKVEHYAAVNGATKASKMEMYDEALKTIPDLISYLQSLHFPIES